MSTQTQTLIKISISNEMKHGEHSYLLQDAMDSIELIPVIATDLTFQIVRISLLNEHILWILLSSNILYEFDFRTKSFSAIEDSQQICDFTIL